MIDETNIINSIKTIEQKNLKKIEEEYQKEQNYKQLLISLKIPKTDDEIRIKLKELNEPINEHEPKYERAERLQNIVLDIIKKNNGIPDYLNDIFKKKKNKKDDILNEEFYTEGSNDLLLFRQEILIYSLTKSTYRLNYLKTNNNNNNINNNYDFKYELTNSFIPNEDNGISKGILTPNEKYFITAGWKGICSIYDIKNNFEHINDMIGHKDKINSIQFNTEKEKNLIITSSNDKTLRLYDLNKILENNNNNNSLLVLKGHENKVNYSEFYPLNNFLGSCSDDCTFRLWDINKSKEILLQEGHNYPIFSFSFQNDGALCASGDLGGIILVFDMRLGKKIKHFFGHSEKIHKIKFLNNCYQFISISADNSIKLWDLRKDKNIFNIPAHNETVTDVQLNKNNVNEFENEFYVSCSLDSYIKIWDKNWNLKESLHNLNEDKYLSVDITKDNRMIIGTTLGREIKIWKKIN